MVTIKIPVSDNLINSLGKDAIEKAFQQLLEELNLKLESKTPKFGSAKGKYKMSDDFDEPLEDFKGMTLVSRDSEFKNYTANIVW